MTKAAEEARERRVAERVKKEREREREREDGATEIKMESNAAKQEPLKRV